MHSLDKTLLAFALLHLYYKAKLTCYSRYLLTFAFQSPGKRCLCVCVCVCVCVLALEGLISLQRTIQIQLLHHEWLGHRLPVEWLALEMN